MTATVVNPNYRGTATGALTIVDTALPPHATGITGTRRSKKGLISITVGFDQELNAASATYPAQYTLLEVAKKGKKTILKAGLSAVAIRYNPGVHSVTLTLKKPLQAYRPGDGPQRYRRRQRQVEPGRSVLQNVLMRLTLR